MSEAVFQPLGRVKSRTERNVSSHKLKDIMTNLVVWLWLDGGARGAGFITQETEDVSSVTHLVFKLFVFC
jgi:hypothetical protein